MKHPEIPSFAYKLFAWFCKDPLFEELEGDLEEAFLANKKKYGVRKARRIYTREVLKMIRPTVVSEPKSGPGYQAALLGSYITISLRNLRRQKLFSFINIFSLSVAMSSGLLVIGLISDLLKFDEFHEHKQEVYRVITTPYYNGNEYKTQASSPLYLGEEMERQIPGIEVVNLGRRFGGDALINGKRLNLTGIYADEHFFDFLSFDLISGSPSALAEPFNVLISESFARKTFEDHDPVGQSIEIAGFGTYQIAGIVADAPKFSHIQFEAIAALSTVHLLARKELIDPTHDQWTNLDRYYNYVYIPENIQKSNVEAWLNTTVKAFYTEPDKATASFELQPINEIIPGPNISDSIGPKMIYLPIIILSVIAAAILLSAIFNYTNLSMARSLRRAREVGVRKLNGASGASIFGQFTIEAIILSLLSLALGILLFWSLRPHFIHILPRAEEMVQLHLTPELIGWFVLFAIITGLVAGMAPSLFFSRLSSLKALRSGKVLKALSGINFRKGLIVSQFALSIIFVLAVVIVHKQYRYSLNLDMGFDKENILNVDLQNNDPKILKTEFLKVPGVSEVSFSSFIPGVGQWQNKQLIDPRNMDSVWVHQMFIDEGYLDNMGIRLIAGRNFRPDENETQETSIIVNEQFLQNFDLGTPSEALGVVFQFEDQSVEIVGVIQDFIYANLEEEINSFILRKVDYYSYANLKIASTDVIGTVERIEDVWNKVDANHRMSSNFLEEHIENYYTFLVDFMKLFGFVGFLAISISCLGLFGMAIYATQTRMKEIGIRKTFGASERMLIFLLSKGFIKMVFWAILIGTPICYLLFDRIVLEEHVYRPEITVVEIGISVLFLLGICMLTIITQTWSAARQNPSQVLRDE